MKTYCNVATLLSLPVVWAYTKRPGYFCIFDNTNIFPQAAELSGWSLSTVLSNSMIAGVIKVFKLGRGCKLAEVLEISCGVNMHPDKHPEVEVFQKLKGL